MSQFRGLSVFVRLYVTFVHCEDIVDMSSLHTTAPCISQIVLKYGLHRSTTSTPNFAPKWSTPVNLSVGDIRRQIAAEWLE